MNAPHDLRVPPQAIESEQSVLGALLLDNRAFDKISGILSESDFYRDDHRRIYRYIVGMVETGIPADIVTVSAAIETSNETDQTGGIAYLADVVSNTVSAANVKRYAENVAETSLRRRLMAASYEIDELATSQIPAQEAVERSQGLIGALADTGSRRGGPRDLNEILGLAIGQIEEAFESGGRMMGLQTGYTDLDARLGGLRSGDMVVLAGRPGMGKTTLGMNIAENVSLSGKQALVFSMEMSDVQLSLRTMSRFATIELDRLRNGKLTNEDFGKIANSLAHLAKANMAIDDTGGLTIGQIHSRARNHKRKKGSLDLIVIDYLGLITPANGKGTRNDDVTAISAGVKRMAKDLQCPIIVLSQLSRKGEERAEKRAMMSDLRDSGSIEQDADIVILMYRDEYYNPQSQMAGFAEANVAKHRNGEPGVVTMVFEGKFSRFKDADIRSVIEANQRQHETKKPPSRGFK